MLLLAILGIADVTSGVAGKKAVGGRRPCAGCNAETLSAVHPCIRWLTRVSTGNTIGAVAGRRRNVQRPNASICLDGRSWITEW